MIGVLAPWFRLRRELPLAADDGARLLPWMVGIMVFLAGLALAAALAVTEAARRWSDELGGHATVQILAPPRTVEPAAMERRVEAALALLRRTPGVRTALPVSTERAAQLVQPWLGEVASLGELPLPRLIEVAFDPARTDLAELKRRLAQEVAGADLDDHQRWLDGLTRLATTIIWVALAILALVATVAALTVVVAVRSSMAIHRDVIEVLHIIGAPDDYIASGFARHAVLAALKGGLGGALLAMLSLVALRASGAEVAPGLLPTLTLGTGAWITILLLPLAAAVIAGLAARTAVTATLARLP